VEQPFRRPEPYDEFVASWPLRSGDPFSDRMISLPKFVDSTTLQEPLEWNATLLDGNVVDAVAKLKDEPGGDLLIYGSSSLVNALLPQRLIDEYRFMLYPSCSEPESGSSKMATPRTRWSSREPRPRARA
jgi:dihydrofolate reductase